MLLRAATRHKAGGQRDQSSAGANGPIGAGRSSHRVVSRPRLPLGTAHLSPALTASAGVGSVGALTTYSIVSHETLRLFEDRACFYAIADLGISLLGGFGAVGLGWTLGPGHFDPVRPRPARLTRRRRHWAPRVTTTRRRNSRGRP